MGLRVKRNGSGGETNSGRAASKACLAQFLCSTEAFLRPDLEFAEAPRAAAVKAGRRCDAATNEQVSRPALTAASTARGFRGRDGWSRQRRQDVILDRAVKDRYGKHRITLYPVGHEGPYPNSSCTGEGKAQNRRDPSERTGSC